MSCFQVFRLCMHRLAPTEAFNSFRAVVGVLVASLISLGRPLPPFLNEGLNWTLWNIVSLESFCNLTYNCFSIIKTPILILIRLYKVTDVLSVSKWSSEHVGLHGAVFWSGDVLRICSRSPTPVPHRATMKALRVVLRLAAQWRSKYVSLSLPGHVKF